MSDFWNARKADRQEGPFPDSQTMAEALGDAILGAYEEEAVHFRDVAHERSIVFQIGHRLVPVVREWDTRWSVDLEYNRWHADELRVLKKTLDLHGGQRSRVLPDLIVHDRDGSSSDHNLLVLEAKHNPSWDNRWADYRKLSAFQSQLLYRYAVFLEFPANAGVPRWRWLNNDQCDVPDPSEIPALVTRGL